MTRNIRWWQVIALVILIAGVFLTIWSAQLQDQFLRTDLLLKTGIARTGISPEQVAMLSGSAADLASPGYKLLKAQLEKIQAADPGIRFAYLMGQREDGTIFLYADSESPESQDYSPPGQLYTEAPVVIGSVFATGEKAGAGPYQDRWGISVSGFIPVTDPTTGRMIAVFGMDVNAIGWNLAIAKDCAAIITSSLLILALVIAFGLAQRRRQSERRRLEASEEKFSRAFQANPALMAVSTIEEGRFLDVNASFLEAIGYSREELIGRTSSDLDLFLDPAQRMTIINRLKETGQVRNVDVKVYRKNRDLLDGSFSAILINIAGVTHLLTVMVDITDRVRTEEELRESEERYRCFFDNAAVAVAIVDPDGYVVEANDMDCRFLGYSRSELIGMHFTQFTHPQDINLDIGLYQLLISGQRQSYEIEKRYVRKDGEVIWGRLAVSLIRDNRGLPSYTLVVCADITERKQVEDALQESEERYRSLAENSPDLIFIINEKDRVDYVNQAAARLLGKPVEDIIGHPRSVFFPMEAAEIQGRHLAEAFAGNSGDPLWREWLLRDKTNEVWQSVCLTPLQGKPGESRRILGVARDITDRKRQEREMTKARADFLFAVSHELKTPLFLMASAQELLESLPAEQQAGRFLEYGEIWNRNLHRLRHLIENLVDSQRSEGMGLKITPVPTDIGEILQQTLKDVELPAQRKRISFRLQLDELPLIPADGESIHRLFENLLTNAIKFSPANSEVEVRLTQQEEEALFTVHDFGAGIAALEIPQLFQPFQRTASADRAVIPGAGLGLYTAKLIVEAHGGSIAMESELGKGTSVAIRLPIHSGIIGT
ncbi:MAG: PAS domain-containing sensor histidine kinase [Coprothermobacterota bacterium]|nr:PAS domain-containing sensor histidine kinase [Coprothermobacterota bacterium]